MDPVVHGNNGQLIPSGHMLVKFLHKTSNNHRDYRRHQGRHYPLTMLTRNQTLQASPPLLPFHLRQLKRVRLYHHLLLRLLLVPVRLSSGNRRKKQLHLPRYAGQMLIPIPVLRVLWQSLAVRI